MQGLGYSFRIILSKYNAPNYLRNFLHRQLSSHKFTASLYLAVYACILYCAAASFTSATGYFSVLLLQIRRKQIIHYNDAT